MVHLHSSSRHTVANIFRIWCARQMLQTENVRDISSSGFTSLLESDTYKTKINCCVITQMTFYVPKHCQIFCQGTDLSCLSAIIPGCAPFISPIMRVSSKTSVSFSQHCKNFNFNAAVHFLQSRNLSINFFLISKKFLF